MRCGQLHPKKGLFVLCLLEKAAKRLKNVDLPNEHTEPHTHIAYI